MVQLFTGNPPQSYGASPAIWDHTVTCHPTEVKVPHHDHSQTGSYTIYLPWNGMMEG